MKKILRSLRIKNNYSQNALASFLEISRQMYSKYENGSAEPSVKNIKKLCALYKVSADVFLQTNDNDPVSYSINNNSELSVSSPAPTFSESKTENNKLFNELIKALPLLQLKEQISLMTRLANIIEKETCSSSQFSIQTKKIKKIPDAEYNNCFNSTELMNIRKASLATIREILKDDEW